MPPPPVCVISQYRNPINVNAMFNKCNVVRNINYSIVRYFRINITSTSQSIFVKYWDSLAKPNIIQAYQLLGGGGGWWVTRPVCVYRR